MNPYEQQREDRIRRNNAMLEKLQVSSTRIAATLMSSVGGWVISARLSQHDSSPPIPAAKRYMLEDVVVMRSYDSMLTKWQRLCKQQLKLKQRSRRT